MTDRPPTRRGRPRSADRAPLPGEVVSRRRKTEKKKEPEEPPLQLDQRVVLAMKPEQRLKWLAQALQKLQQGKVQSSGVYDILVHPRFPRDASDRIGVKMYRVVAAHAELFSQKQRRYLDSDCKLVQLYKEKAAASEDGGNGSGGADPTPDDDTEEALHALVEKLLTSTGEEAQKMMDGLGDASRERLEELLEARILARARANAASPDGGAAAEGGGGQKKTAEASNGDRRRSSSSSSRSSSSCSNSSSSCSSSRTSNNSNNSSSHSSNSRSSSSQRSSCCSSSSHISSSVSISRRTCRNSICLASIILHRRRQRTRWGTPRTSTALKECC